jgi:hypothetical protein
LRSISLPNEAQLRVELAVLRGRSSFPALTLERSFFMRVTDSFSLRAPSVTVASTFVASSFFVMGRWSFQMPSGAMSGFSDAYHDLNCEWVPLTHPLGLHAQLRGWAVNAGR